MDWIGAIFCPDQLGYYYYLILLFTLIATIYLYDQITRINCQKNFLKKFLTYNYDNLSPNGPANWKNLFQDANGKKQSPINLLTRNCLFVPSELNHLVFSEEFHQNPCEIKIVNNGLNLIVYGKWGNAKIPNIKGGPLLENEIYNFSNIRFRWGPNDNEGSEHMVNTKKFSVEMQVAFQKKVPLSCENQHQQSNSLSDLAKNGHLLIISYFFLTTSVENPYLEPIIQSLNLLKRPMSCALIRPFPLKLLTPLFRKSYFYYEGSLTFPPCTEGVKWIVQSNPLIISSRQVQEFRKLGSKNGTSSSATTTTIRNNTRPVQIQNCNDILFYD